MRLSTRRGCSEASPLEGPATVAQHVRLDADGLGLGAQALVVLVAAVENTLRREARADHALVASSQGDVLASGRQAAFTGLLEVAGGFGRQLGVGGSSNGSDDRGAEAQAGAGGGDAGGSHGFLPCVALAKLPAYLVYLTIKKL